MGVKNRVVFEKKNLKFELTKFEKVLCICKRNSKKPRAY